MYKYCTKHWTEYYAKRACHQRTVTDSAVHRQWFEILRRSGTWVSGRKFRIGMAWPGRNSSTTALLAAKWRESQPFWGATHTLCALHKVEKRGDLKGLGGWQLSLDLWWMLPVKCVCTPSVKRMRFQHWNILAQPFWRTILRWIAAFCVSCTFARKFAGRGSLSAPLTLACFVVFHRRHKVSFERHVVHGGSTWHRGGFLIMKTKVVCGRKFRSWLKLWLRFKQNANSSCN